MPFGANQIVALNERLGAYDRCKGGMFTAQVDDDPTANTLSTEIGLTSVEILDFEDTEYINFEAEINYPEEEGIVQVSPCPPPPPRPSHSPISQQTLPPQNSERWAPTATSVTA